jgi:hypothetical protein
MSAILDLPTYWGRIGNLYGRFGLCPPFALRDAVEGWIAYGWPLWHCLDVIERYLCNAGSCYSGSGDRNFAWLNSLIQTSSYERQVPAQGAISKQPKMQRAAHRQWGFIAKAGRDIGDY